MYKFLGFCTRFYEYYAIEDHKTLDKREFLFRVSITWVGLKHRIKLPGKEGVKANLSRRLLLSQASGGEIKSS